MEKGNVKVDLAWFERDRLPIYIDQIKYIRFIENVEEN